MESNINFDYLNFASDPEITSKFIESKSWGYSCLLPKTLSLILLFFIITGSEVLLMSARVKKWNNFYYSQERNFVITNVNIYNLRKKKVRRVVEIKNLAGVTKNLTAYSKEFVVHVFNEPDFRLVCD
jgi:hypothetical protein